MGPINLEDVKNAGSRAAWHYAPPQFTSCEERNV